MSQKRGELAGHRRLRLKDAASHDRGMYQAIKVLMKFAEAYFKSYLVRELDSVH